MRFLSCDSLVVFLHAGFSLWNVDSRCDVLASVLCRITKHVHQIWSQLMKASRTHLGISANLLQAISVNPSGQVTPERVADHPSESIDGVLRESSFIEDDLSLSVIASECEFLQKVGEHVGSSDLLIEQVSRALHH